MKFDRCIKAVLAFSTGFGALSAWGSGYEKSIMWGGQSAGLAGVATPYISGSQSLYLNPAGLGAGATTQDVTLNISPAWPQFKGPINNQNYQESSSSEMVTPYSLSYAYKFNDTWAIGVGTYISGGAKAVYEDVVFAGFQGTTETKTDLVLTEYALGGSFKLNDQWSFGAAWRIAEAKADFSFVKRLAATQVANSMVTDLKDTQYDAFKLGAQWKPTEGTLVGLTYRSEVEFEAEGKVQTMIHTPASIVNAGSSDADVATVFPQQLTLGARQDLSPSWKLFGEYAWTQYSRVKDLKLVTPTATTVVEQNWKDQHNLRLAAEYMTPIAVPVRFGYGYTSQVTDSSHARAAFVPPAPAHTLTLGSGYEFNSMFALDGGFEYTWAKGNSKNGTAAGPSGTAGNAAGQDIRDGSFEVTEYAVHLGAKLMF